MGYQITLFQQRKLDAAFAKADREAALRKQDGRCKYCLCKLTYKNVTRDHVVARAMGGLDHRDNIVAACARCNRAKGKLSVKLFVRMVSFPQPGEPMAFRMIWFDRRLNKALDEMETNVFRAVGIRR
ncbi:HNH endonuclease signature motif containing protein [Rhizobium sp. SSA_523]|uniref:HNH endonuclease n=1 Tax=Rhizobium sp. SSA_523 TaxID=2952477 RepID=UPI002090FE3C|nr:HNH endonuclease signature motif containing protein [Rhizobium sp. SSA_523]MCO5730132.1 HNH endonuclease [Rhizobium sp. SSA_523]WKC25196.1 HNH endonuclease signature motif containing protein [Rhizobium sp. SSA_523]